MGVTRFSGMNPWMEWMNKGAFSTVLFDMDGLLFDSMPNHAYAWSRAMTQFGLSTTEEEVYMNEGRTGSQTVDLLAQRCWGRNATEEEKRGIYAAKTEVFNTLPKPKPMPGAYETLQVVKDLGMDIILVTGSATHSLLDRLMLHFPGFFHPEKMVTGFDVKYGKPHPEPYLMGLKKAGITAEKAIVVENAPLGVQSARAAGIFTIAANTGPLSDIVLLEAGANVVLSGMMAVASWFRKGE